MAAIEVSSLFKSYGALRAVDGISFDAQAGEGGDLYYGCRALPSVAPPSISHVETRRVVFVAWSSAPYYGAFDTRNGMTMEPTKCFPLVQHNIRGIVHQQRISKNG